MAAVLAKASPSRVVEVRPTQTTFETSNRYVQSFLAYDLFSAIEVCAIEFLCICMPIIMFVFVMCVRACVLVRASAHAVVYVIVKNQHFFNLFGLFYFDMFFSLP